MLKRLKETNVRFYLVVLAYRADGPNKLSCTTKEMQEQVHLWVNFFFSFSVLEKAYTVQLSLEKGLICRFFVSIIKLNAWVC